MKTLSKRRTQLLQRLQTRHGRRKTPFFLCEGRRVCAEARQHRPDAIEFVVVADGADADAWQGFDCCRVEPDALDALGQTESRAGVLLVAHRPACTPALATDRCVPVLDGVRDPGNAGTILRTAWALGLPAVAWTGGTCDLFNPKVVRAGMGAHFALDLPRFDDLTQLHTHAPERNLWVAAPHEGLSCYDDTFAPAGGFLVFGNEAHGATPPPAAAAVTIPMPGDAESLNVAQAATVLLFEAQRRNRL